MVKIKKEEVSYSEVLRREFNFSELKPRGHYTSSDKMQNYFRAFKYFTTCIYNDWGKLAVSSEIPELLNKLPMEVRQYAIKWIESYSGFISSPKNKIVWNDLNFKPPSYCKYPDTTPKIFPLSWGFDNEILYSTVYHENFPPEEQITGNSSERLLPSGIDIAASFGNGLADSLLSADYKTYPNLYNVIRNLHEKFRKFEKKFSTSDNLYDRWISALAVQWADSVMSVNGENDKNIWKAKRLQTGLASWTTLRHATGLVNERGAAECGEGGLWEYLWLRAPRGYVEPDPYTFEAIAGMFDVSADFVANKLKNKELKSEKTSLYEGIIKWLKSSAQDCRTFKLIAEKEKRGESLSSQEYKTIFGIGSIAEYAFLVFKSLSNNDNGISNPDPIPKIYDVSGNGSLGYLMAAVGYPIDWDYITPFYGRHQIVKGAVYSYYEFASEKLLNDKEWLDDIKKRETTTWTKPFFTEIKNEREPGGIY